MSHEPTVDYGQAKRANPYCEATDGSEYDGDECWVIPVLVPVEGVPDLLASYDPEDASSPSEETSRTLARVILDALMRKSQEG